MTLPPPPPPRPPRPPRPPGAAQPGSFRPAYARPAPPPDAAARNDPAEAYGRMTAISHTGALPWVQLRNAIFQPAVFRKMIGRIDPRAKNGDLVAVYDRDAALFGTGLLSLNAPIGLRMLTFDAAAGGGGGAPVGEGIIAERLAQAVRLRKEFLSLETTTNAYRVVHAEGDGLPGLIVDKYDETAVMELFNFPIYRRVEAIREELKMLLGVKKVLVRADARVEEAEGFQLEENAPGPQAERSPDRKSTIVIENGVRFQIDLTHGHKTGFFTDQRENRKALTAFTEGKVVLDLCAYSGGFGVYAATLGKAANVTCVDLDEDAIALAQRNANLNKVPRQIFETVHTDLFPYLRQLQAGGAGSKRFDVVVLDPPKIIYSREELEEGRMKYFDMNRLALTVVKPGGLLVTCSCSGLFTPEDFFNVVKGAGRGARRRVQVLRASGAGADHPVMTDHPESSYLKCLWCRVW